MNRHLKVIQSIFCKDSISLIPLLVVVYLVIAFDAIVTRVDPEVTVPFLANLIEMLPAITLLTIGLLTLAVVQLDPAASLDHDWLVRPIPKYDLIISKLVYLIVVLTLPIMLIRAAVNLALGDPFMPALVDASIAEFPFTIPAILFFVAVATLSATLFQSAILVVTVILLFTVFAVAWEAFTPQPGALGDNSGATQATLPLMGTIMFISFSIIAMLIYWLQYSKRISWLARVVFVSTVVVGTFIFILPFNFGFWGFFLNSMRSNLVDADFPIAEDLELSPLYGCYPSARLVGEGSEDLAFDPPEFSQIATFQDRDIRAAGSGALAFTSRVSAWGVADTTMIYPLKAVAHISSEELSEKVSLRSSQITSYELRRHYTNFLDNDWIIPADVVNSVKSDPDTRVSIDYSLLLLTSFRAELEMDGKTRKIPKFGYCSATRDSVGNRVEVECIKRGVRPTLVGAQLYGIESSHVFARTPEFTSQLSQLISGRKYNIVLENPSLTQSSTIELVGYESRAIVERSTMGQRLLGGTRSDCSIPEDQSQPTYAQNSWNDASPHQILYIPIEDDVNLEVLDWGGSGSPLVFLAGLGSTGHSFDEIAPEFTDNHRVIAITRRGFGNSSKPNSGYTMDRLTQDILQVLNALEIEAPILVGHSIAGDELSTFAARYPDRVSGLVYLDAAYDRTLLGQESLLLPEYPRPSREDLSSYEQVKEYYSDLEIAIPTEGSLMSIMDIGSGRRIGDPSIAGAIISQVESPPYAEIAVPAIAFYAVASSPQYFMRPWYPNSDARITSEINKQFDILTGYQLDQIAKFEAEVKNSEAVIIENADHAIFISHKEEVASSILRFVEEINIDQ